MKTKVSKAFKCFKCLVVFYLVLICISGISVAVFTTYLLIFRQESKITKPRIIVVCFSTIPILLSLLSTILGWVSIKRKNISLLKFFAVLLAITDILQIAGCLWCFISLPQINEDVFSYMEEKFSIMASDTLSENWWNDIQAKLKCCGLQGPTDYSTAKGVPFSCCGSDPEDGTKGSCSFLWQKGCASILTKQVSQDLLLLGLIGLGVAFLQEVVCGPVNYFNTLMAVPSFLLNENLLKSFFSEKTAAKVPGIFISWCFARRMSKESL